MKIKKIKQWIKESTKFPIMCIGLLLIGWYVLTLASFLVSSPSEGMSREVVIDYVDYGELPNNQSHVLGIPIDGGNTILAAVDGHTTKILLINALGERIQSFNLNLDLYKATYINGYMSGENEITLFYVYRDLFQVTIDTQSQNFEQNLLVQGVKSIVNQKEWMIIQQESGLFGLNPSEPDVIYPLIENAINSYDAVVEGENINILATTKIQDSFSIEFISANKDYEIIEKKVLVESTKDDYLKNIKDIYIKDSVLTSLFVWTDKRDGLDYLTFFQMNMDTFTVSDSFREGFEIHKSRFTIEDVNQGSVNVIMQKNTINGINLVLASIESGKEPSIKPLTKTRYMSKLANYFVIDGEVRLIFSDLEEDKRSLLYASSKSELIASTTDIRKAEPWNLIVVTILVALMAFFMGAVTYLLLTSVAPMALVIIMDKGIQKYKLRPNVYLQNGIAAVIQTFSKIYLTYHIIHNIGSFNLRPLVFGNEPTIYIALSVLSFSSYLIMVRYMKQNSHDSDRASKGYIRYIGSDYVQYTLFVIVYVCTYLIIGKI